MFAIQRDVGHAQCYGYRFALHIGSVLLLAFPAKMYAHRLELLTPCRLFRFSAGRKDME